MNQTQIPFLVEALLILVAMVLGILIKSAGKPYGKVKLGIHLFLYLWFSIGFVFILPALPYAKLNAPILAFVALMGLAILTQASTGIWMIASKRPLKILPKIHAISASLLLLSDIMAFILSGINS